MFGWLRLSQGRRGSENRKSLRGKEAPQKIKITSLGDFYACFQGYFGRSLIGNCEWGGGFQEGGFQIVERAAFSSRGNLLLQGNSYLKSTLRLLLRRRV